MKYLIETTENYRVESEAEAKELIEQAKQGNKYLLKKYSSQYKERKQKGEVIDAWYKVTLVKVFNDEKEPNSQVEIVYDEGSAF
jgi:hypothetical protein